jgi:regulator of cell morphogenesis and NO signaling
MMSKIFSVEEQIGKIAAKFPKSMEIFKEYNIDFCCGGDRVLGDVIKEQKLNAEEIMTKIEAEYNKVLNEINSEVDWNTASYSKLIDYVINTHHAYLVEKLPKISELSAKILRVHGENHEELRKVYKLFHSLKMELEQHLIKEEEIVFPLIKEYEKNNSNEVLDKALKTITELEDEHEGAGDILKELREVTDGYSVPADGCNTYRLTYNLLEELEGDLFKHIHLENNILFPRLAEEK